MIFDITNVLKMLKGGEEEEEEQEEEEEEECRQEVYTKAEVHNQN